MRLFDPVTRRQAGKTLSVPDPEPDSPVGSFGETVLSLAFSPEGDRLAAGGIGAVRLWDPRSGELIRTFPTAKHAAVNAIAFSPDGTLMVTAADEESGAIRVWHTATGEPAARR